MKTKLIIIALAALSLCSCYRINYRMSGDGDNDRAIYSTEAWNSYFVWGMVPTTPAYQVADICQQRRMLEMRSSVSPQNVLASLFSANFYSASTIEAKCLK